MEAPGGSGGITPLPPPEPEAVRPEMPPARVPWIPALIALAAILGFAAWLSAGNESATEDASGDSETTLAPFASTTTGVPTTLPPLLEELVPWVDGSLLILERVGNETNLLVWNSRAREPREFPFSSPNVLAAALDPGTMNFVAYETAGNVRSLYLGGWRNQEPAFIGSQGFAWDPRGEPRLAWVGTDQLTGITALYSKEISGPTVLHGELPAESQLLAWTEDGLVLSEIRGERVALPDPTSDELIVKRPIATVLRAPDGELLATALAEPLAVGGATIIALGTADAFVATGVAVDPESLAPPDEIVILQVEVDAGGEGFVADALPDTVLGDGEPLITRDGAWTLAPSGASVARITAGEPVNLAVQDLPAGELLVIGLGGERDLIGFTPDERFLSVFDPATGSLEIIQWDGSLSVLSGFGDAVRPNGVYPQP